MTVSMAPGFSTETLEVKRQYKIKNHEPIVPHLTKGFIMKVK